jgi:uncharacterized protein
MQRFDCGLVEIKATGDDQMTFTGYGAVFGNVDSYGDVIQAGAFGETLRAAKTSGQWPAMLSQHGGMLGGADDMMPIGVWTDMAEDGRGLWVEGKLAPTTRGREAYELLRMKPRPALNGLSIGFVAKEYTVGTKPKEPRRTLKNIDLMEVSIVTMPANPKARVTGVKAENNDLTLREFEAFLRDEGGFSHAAAKVIAARGYKAFLPDLRDEDGEGELVKLVRKAASVLNPSLQVP